MSEPLTSKPVLRGDKQCPHGHTARKKCDVCDHADEIAEKDAEIERLDALRDSAVKDCIAREAERDMLLNLMRHAACLLHTGHVVEALEMLADGPEGEK